MPLSKTTINKFVKEALREDAARQDITTLSFIPRQIIVQARIVSSQEGVVCGVSIIRQVFKAFDKNLIFKARKKDGSIVRKGGVISLIEGRARSILSCERVALNFLSYLSGISTQTYKAVEKVRSKGIQILDTRKTTPLLRSFEKYAVLMGKGMNHRFDLSQQYLVKDNHLAILKKTKSLLGLVSRSTRLPFEIEVEDIKTLKKALSLYPDIVMLDNFTPAGIRSAVALLQKKFPDKDRRPFVELSGGICLENISRFAIKGVDFISLGSLTHSTKALDVSLEIVKCYGYAGF